MATSRSAANGGRFRKGRSKTSGRRRGTPNRVSRDWKDLVRSSCCEDADAQEALRRACLKHPELLFKAAEHAFGKPRQSVEVDRSREGVIALPPGDDVAKA